MKEEKRTIYRRRNIGFIFQSFQLVSELNVEQNIIFPLLLDYQKPDPKKVNEILNLLGLAERRYHLPRTATTSSDWESFDNTAKTNFSR